MGSGALSVTHGRETTSPLPTQQQLTKPFCSKCPVKKEAAPGGRTAPSSTRSKTPHGHYSTAFPRPLPRWTEEASDPHAPAESRAPGRDGQHVLPPHLGVLHVRKQSLSVDLIQANTVMASNGLVIYRFEA